MMVVYRATLDSSDGLQLAIHQGSASFERTEEKERFLPESSKRKYAQKVVLSVPQSKALLKRVADISFSVTT